MGSSTGIAVLDGILAFAAACVALTAIAAAARKPPLRWVGHWLAFIFRQLLGDPIAGWLERETESRVRPIVREEVAAATSPIVDDVRHLHDCVEKARQDAVRAVEAAEVTADTTRDTNTKVTGFASQLGEVSRTLEERGEILKRAVPLIERAEPLLKELEGRSEGS